MVSSEGPSNNRRSVLIDMTALGGVEGGVVHRVHYCRVQGIGIGVRLHDAVRRTAERTQVNPVLHVILLQLGQDVFSISVLPQGGNMGPDL